MRRGWVGQRAESLISFRARGDRENRAHGHGGSQRNPPSTKHLSERLGYADDRLMRKRFPALCAAISTKRRKWKAGLPARIRPSIEKALLEDQPTSLLEIARRNGIGTVATLKKYCPALKRKLEARQAAFRKARDAQRRAALEQALTGSPAPPLADVAKRLRLSKAQLRAQFYDLCTALGKRYRMGFRNRIPPPGEAYIGLWPFYDRNDNCESGVGTSVAVYMDSP